MLVTRTLVCCVGIPWFAACSSGSAKPVDTTDTSNSTSISSTNTPTSTATPTVSPTVAPPGTHTTASNSESQGSGGTSNPGSSTTEAGAEESTESTTATEPIASGGDSSSTSAGESTSDVAEGTSDAPAKQTWVFTTASGGPLRAFKWNAQTSKLDVAGEQSVGSAPNEDVFVAIVPGSTQAFVVTNKTIVVYNFDPATGEFTEGARGTTSGNGTYVSVSADLQHVYVAHYNENALSYLTYKDGVFSAPQRFDAGQKVHSVQEAKAGGWVLVPCLGSDHVAQYRRNGDTLAAATPASVAVTGGPRHFAYHPSKPLVYVLTELSAQLRAFEFNDTSGLGAVLDTEVIGVESGGKYWGSDVKVSPDGKDVFAVERNSKKVFHFDVEEDGALTPSGVSVDLGGVVRAFDISSDGKQLFMGNDKGVLEVLGFDSQSNELTSLAEVTSSGDKIYTTLARDF